MSIHSTAEAGSQSVRIFLLLFVFLLSAIALRSDTHTAASCSQVDVQAAINAASDGDTVQVPAGTATWSSSLTINKPISIIGGGSNAGGTILTSSGALSKGFFNISAALSSSGLLQITGFTFRGESTSVPSRHINFESGCSLSRLRINNNTFHFGNTQLEMRGCYGVIDNNYFYNPAFVMIFSAGTRAQANASWDDMTPGTANALFFENNHIIINKNYGNSRYVGEMVDMYQGGKLIIRYNDFDASAAPVDPDTQMGIMWIQMHGSDFGYWQRDYNSASYRRAPSIVEIYSNTFVAPETNNLLIQRGTSVLCYDNIMTGTSINSWYVKMYEEEYMDTHISEWNPTRTAWPAEDTIHNTFFWGNTANAVAMTSSNVYTMGQSEFIQLNRDYFIHAPQSSGGKEYFTGLNGGSAAYPTNGILYPTLGNMVFTPNGPNAHYPYIPYVYPHPLTVQEESGRLLDLQTVPNGSTLALSWQSIIGAVSYRVVRDWQNAQAIVVTGTGWTDTAPAGEHVYMVYALDGSGKILAAEGKLVNTVPQVFSLAAGWNWIAFNVLPSALSLNSVFSGILDKVEQVKTQTQSAIRSGGNWKGGLADMAGIGQYKMYKVKVSSACTLTVTGTAISPTTPIQLGAGWNWVAYLPSTAMPIAMALYSIKGQVLQIKSLTQSATYNGSSWSGTFDMQPGQGYAIKMSAPGILIYPGGK